MGTKWALLGLAACSACFFDSSWGATKRGQVKNAANATPAALGTSEDEHHVHERMYHLRAYVTDRFQSQEVGWDRQVRDIVWGANEILAPTVGVRLELDDMTSWKVANEQDLDAMLTELHGKDDGGRVDWVAGFAGSMPLVSESFHDAGRADVIGKHLVVRAATTERDAIDRAFNELGEREREKLAHERKRHRAVAVFLHEIGHTLGALHETDAQSVMHSEYNRKMSGYSADAIGLMRATLEHRDDNAEVLATSLLKLLEAPPPTPWIEGERTAQIARLRAVLPKAVVKAEPAPIDEVAELQGDDRAAYRRAVQLSRDDDRPGAWNAAEALFKKYPAVYAVQDLRCTLAMTLVGWPGSQTECAALMKLSHGRPK